MNKTEQLELEKRLGRLIDKIGIDEMINQGCIKMFNNKEEMDEFYKNKNKTKPTKNNTLVVGGDVGERVINKIQRNQKCPCGSGLKYKKCCL
mgnify:FL=1